MARAGGGDGQLAMRPFDSLTPRGKLRRLRQLTLTALAGYRLDVARVRFLTEATNTMFRVDAHDGGRYVFRIYAEDDSSSMAENQSEMFWLQAILRDTDLPVCEPVPRADGGLVTLASAEGLPGVRRCALFRWVPGRPLEEVITPESYRQLGSIMAGLHNHAETLTLPEHIRPKRWDTVFYYPGEPVVYRLPECAHLFSPAQVQVIDCFCEAADATLADLYRQREPILIHADMHGWNVHIHRGKLTVIDFEDVLLGYPVQDIANSLYYFRLREDFPALRAAFEAGYAAVRPLPRFSKRDLDMLWGARMTMFMNYVARKGYEDGDKEFIDSRCAMLEKILDECNFA